MYRTSDRRRRGLTLIELLIASLAVSILMGAVMIVYSTGVKTFYSQQARSGVKSGEGKLLTDISRELRQATSVTESLPKSVTFTADIDDDGLDETVRYVWSGASGDPLNRTLTDPPPAGSAPVTTKPIINSVKNIIFTYYNASNSSTTAASAVRLVSIDMEVDYKSEAFRLRTGARPRGM